MRIDIHSHLMSVAFLGHLQGRDALPTAVRDAEGFIAHCAPLLSLPYRAPILSAEELQRTACAVMAFGFAEVTTVDQVLNRIPVPAAA